MKTRRRRAVTSKGCQDQQRQPKRNLPLRGLQGLEPRRQRQRQPRDHQPLKVRHHQHRRLRQRRQGPRADFFFHSITKLRTIISLWPLSRLVASTVIVSMLTRTAQCPRCRVTNLRGSLASPSFGLSSAQPPLSSLLRSYAVSILPLRSLTLVRHRQAAAEHDDDDDDVDSFRLRSRSSGHLLHVCFWGLLRILDYLP